MINTHNDEYTPERRVINGKQLPDRQEVSFETAVSDINFLALIPAPLKSRWG